MSRIAALMVFLAMAGPALAGEPAPADRVEAVVDPGPFECPAEPQGTFEVLPGSGDGGGLRWTDDTGAADLTWEWPAYDAATGTFSITLKARRDGRIASRAKIGFMLAGEPGREDYFPGAKVDPDVHGSDGTFALPPGSVPLLVEIVAVAGQGEGCRVVAATYRLLR